MKTPTDEEPRSKFDGLFEDPLYENQDLNEPDGEKPDLSFLNPKPVRCVRCGTVSEYSLLRSLSDEHEDGYPDGWEFVYLAGLLCGECAPVVKATMRLAAFDAIVSPSRTLAPEAAAWRRPDVVAGRYAAIGPNGEVVAATDNFDELRDKLDGKGMYTKIWIHVQEGNR